MFFYYLEISNILHWSSSSLLLLLCLVSGKPHCFITYQHRTFFIDKRMMHAMLPPAISIMHIRVYAATKSFHRYL